MSTEVRPSNQKSIVQRLRHLQKFEWVKNHDTYNAGLTTWEGREILAEIDRQWDVNVANHTHAETITADLFKARAKIERLRAALEKYGDHTQECNFRNDVGYLGCNCGFTEAAPPAETFGEQR